MAEAGERQLIERIKQGNKEAFKELVGKYKKPLYFYCYRLCRNQADAEDLSQEVFIKVYQKIIQFREESKILTWIYRIAGNLFIDKSRKKVLTYTVNDSQDRDASFDTLAAHLETDELNPEKQVESVIIQKHIDAAMHKLSEKEKTAFILKHHNGLAIKEIAAIFNTSEGTVKSHLFRAIKKLQTSLSFYKNELGLEES